MNRREALTSALAAASCGLTLSGSELAVDKDDELIAFKIKYAGRMTCEQHAALRDSMARVFKGTRWEGVPVLMCASDVDVQVVKRSDADNRSDYYAQMMEHGRLTKEEIREHEQRNPRTA